MRMRTLVAASVAALGLLALTGGPAAGGAAPTERAAACTAKQQKQRQQAIAAYRKRMPKDRARYFRKHSSKKKRAVFVKKQQAHLKALRRALARCSKIPVKPAPVKPAPEADLSLTISAAGINQVTYTLTVRNAGPAAASETSLSDSLPAALTFVEVRTTQGTCVGGTAVVCGLGSVPSGAEVTVTVVAWTRGGTSTNSAVVGSHDSRSPARQQRGKRRLHGPDPTCFDRTALLALPGPRAADQHRASQHVHGRRHGLQRVRPPCRHRADTHAVRRLLGRAGHRDDRRGLRPRRPRHVGLVLGHVRWAGLSPGRCARLLGAHASSLDLLRALDRRLQRPVRARGHRRSRSNGGLHALRDRLHPSVGGCCDQRRPVALRVRQRRPHDGRAGASPRDVCRTDVSRAVGARARDASSLRPTGSLRLRPDRWLGQARRWLGPHEQAARRALRVA